MVTLDIKTATHGYGINIGSGLLDRAAELFNLKRRVLIVTDSGVPSEYARKISEAAGGAPIYVAPEGEGAKSLEIYGDIMKRAAELELSRGDALVAVGGGVVGDLTGFVASTYMRGIDFYNVPTTLLSQVDSSVGGKCAINLGGIKNIVGSFYPPRGVLIDTDTLKTLPKRQIASGLSEAIKMSLTSNEALFCYFEENEINEENISYVITEALKIKAAVVEEDEHEAGLRKILNFGHTLGHGIESVEGLSGLYHGECVALGMLPMCAPEVKERLIPVLKRAGLPTSWDGSLDEAIAFCRHDKKRSTDGVDTVLVPAVGDFVIKNMAFDELERRIKANF